MTEFKRKPLQAQTLKRLLAESHRLQFNGADYQAVTNPMWQEWDMTEDQLAELETAPDPGCECGFCTTEWQ